jgi:quercetin dioxygenase-like cupin family protein
MATHHAIAGEQVDLATWANDLPNEHSKVIVKNKEIELARLVLQAGSEMHKTDYCRVKGTIVIHCLDGEIKVRTRDTVETLMTGQLLYLEGGTEHALMGVTKSVVLLTIVLC